MNAAIRPGTLCLLMGTMNPEINGRIVTAVRYVPHDLFMTPSGLVYSDAWEVAAPWIDATMPNHARPSHLIPLNDPDADLSADAEDTLPRTVEEVGDVQHDEAIALEAT